MDQLDAAVWAEVCQLLEDPGRVLQEYQRRLERARTGPRRPELQAVECQLARVRQGIDGLIDSYAEGVIDKTEFTPRLAECVAAPLRLEAGPPRWPREMAESGPHLQTSGERQTGNLADLV